MTTTVPLRSVAEVLVSNVDKKSVEGERPVRLCNYTDVYYKRRITPDLEFMEATASSDQISKFRLRVGDVIITKDSETPEDIAVPAYVAETAPDLVCGYHLAIIRPRPSRVAGPFLGWLMQSDAVREQLSARATGVTRYGLTYEAIQGVAVDLPPLEEQILIARFLDEQTTRADSVSAEYETLAASLAERVAAERDLAIPQDSVQIPLGQCVRAPINYGVLMPGPNLGVQGVPLVEAGDAMRGPIEMNRLRRTSPETEAEYRRSRLQPGDLVMAIRGSVGGVQVMPSFDGLCNVTRDAARISLRRDKFDPAFVRQVIRTRRTQEWLRLRVGGAAVTGINIADLRRVPVPALPFQHQQLISRQLDEDEADATASLKQLRQARALLEERKRALITACVTGEFDIKTASDRAGTAALEGVTT